jgi:hypothetical protein
MVEVRTAGAGWEESTFGPTIDAALNAVWEPEDYPNVHIVYITNHDTRESWHPPVGFTFRDHEEPAERGWVR